MEGRRARLLWPPSWQGLPSPAHPGRRLASPAAPTPGLFCTVRLPPARQGKACDQAEVEAALKAAFEDVDEEIVQTALEK